MFRIDLRRGSTRYRAIEDLARLPKPVRRERQLFLCAESLSAFSRLPEGCWAGPEGEAFEVGMERPSWWNRARSVCWC